MSSSTLAAVDFGQGVSDAWRAVAVFVPKFVVFLLILLVGWFVARLLARVVDGVLERVGFDRVVERGGIRRMLARSQYDPSDIIAKLVYYAVLLITLQIAFGLWGPNPVSALLTGIVAWLPRAAVAIIILVVAGAIARAVRDLIRGTLGGLTYGNLLGTIAAVFIWGLGIIAALNQIGVATAVTLPVLITVLATVGGILVVGVGGGLVRPMQQRWETWLGRAENEIPTMRAHAQAYQRGREDAVRAADQPTEQLQPQHVAAGQMGAAGYPQPGQMASGHTPAGQMGQMPADPTYPSGRQQGMAQEQYPTGGPAYEQQYRTGGTAYEQYPAGATGPDQPYPAGGMAHEQYPAGGTGHEQYPAGGPDQEQYPAGGTMQEPTRRMRPDDRTDRDPM